MGNRNKKRMVIALLTLCLCAAIAGGNEWERNQRLATSVNFIMDTVIEQKLYGKQSEEAVREINHRLQVYEKTCSMYLENSEVWKINQNAGIAPIKVSPELRQLIQKAKDFSAQTDGVFDISVAPLTSLWGITSDHPKVPAQDQIDAARKLVNYHDVQIQGDTVMLQHRGQAIDLGAIAKGAACDIVREVATEYQIKTGCVSIGGNLVVLGDDLNGKPFLFGIRDPLKGESDFIGTLSLTGKTMATTGTYERFFEENGKKYHHILDPRTGYPAESDLLSVSVISEDGTLADFLSTTFFLMGKQTVLQALDREEFQLVAVDKQGQIYLSKALLDCFQLNKQTAYQIVAL